MMLVIDLEATCDEGNEIPPEQMEIIEVGAVWVGDDGSLVDTFQCFVRPTVNPALTAFCRTLTHIEQTWVDAAATWQTVSAELARFADRHAAAHWGSWGAYDCRQIERECARHGLPNPLGGLSHQNLKAQFAKKRRIKQVGMARALQILGLPLVGEHHRALSDACNIASLLSFDRDKIQTGSGL